MTTVLQPIDRFNGDFEFLPLAAQIRYGAIPAIVTGEWFQLAAVTVADDLNSYAEAHWYIEAIRERRINPARSLNEAMRDINARVARRLYERSRA